MREACGAAGDVRTVGSVVRLEDEEAREGQQAGLEGMAQLAAVQQWEKPEWLGSPQNEHVGRRGKDW